MKNKFAALIMATFVATPVMAQNIDNQVFANDNVKAIELSQTEMQETQGEWAPVAYGIRMGVMGTIGAAGGAWNHYSNTGEFSWAAAGRGFAIGAIGGGAAKFLGGKGW